MSSLTGLEEVHWKRHLLLGLATGHYPLPTDLSSRLIPSKHYVRLRRLRVSHGWQGRLAEPSAGGSCQSGRLGEATLPCPALPSLTRYHQKATTP